MEMAQLLSVGTVNGDLCGNDILAGLIFVPTDRHVRGPFRCANAGDPEARGRGRAHAAPLLCVGRHVRGPTGAGPSGME
jgi:hypothetical protein